MSILNEFRTDVALNALYRGRVVAERLEAQRQLDEAEVQAIRDALERERAEKEAERAAKEAERAEKETALAQKEAERAAKEAALAQIADLKKRLGLDEA
jgi:Skp family chaperone for outer membrane proteins